MTDRRLEWVTYVVVAIYFAATIASYEDPRNRGPILKYVIMGSAWPLTGAVMVFNTLIAFPADARIHSIENTSE